MTKSPAGKDAFVAYRTRNKANWLSNQDPDRKRIFSNPAPPSKLLSSIPSNPHSTGTMTGENDCNTANTDFLTLKNPPSAHLDEEHWDFDNLIAPEDGPYAIIPPSPSRVPAFATSDEPIIRTTYASVKAFLEVTPSNVATEPRTYRLEFHQAVDFFGADLFTHEPGRRRLVLARRQLARLNTPFFKFAMEAGLPSTIFNWLQGEPDTEDLDFSASHIDRLFEELTRKGISSAELWRS
ncbi:hypothetical protein HBI56_042430 [Parastagonospora nodorum]|uniref:Uncharacterized protein n=1 Tax=Phaeosphaeria nodorum (strain SN15 / ATCC MYA-4574 / FGSC 10173) TaxID=321614 RepID=A0A7U2EU82_PHANO|nr:hypothetical protein HBH56_240670 [Parastagonospora nodorum]QRC93173.1 hypothetical protein JI435_429030 [Parastagonospora nodorum SN15]KAH3932441.1 hypothetical protein HBH54_083770 [Parastagonospora nodorum]KAH3955221.1 hypothetical protein HBH53_010600 [Parastagonospora nodorum]KAH3986494.1 hypothetical protein HBH52_041800 [Parastagonospora nodorum]